MESADDVAHDFFDGNVGMFPGVYNTGCNILEDDGSHVSGRWIEDIGEVVFGKHRVRRVSTIGICPWFVLVLSVRVSANTFCCH